jgi:penicillin-binding protein 2
LEAGTATGETTFFCPGSASFYGRTFRCWQAGGHGRVDLHRALVQSCDVFFYNLGKELGIEKMAEYSSHFGLGRPTGIDLPNEESGTVPSPAWKEKRFRQQWYAGETISVAIGQGALTTTPLQLAYAVGGIASGGRFFRPKLVMPASGTSQRSRDPKDLIEFPLSSQTVALVTDAMFGVVNEGGGTGVRARVVGLDIGGKTGTAQVASLQTARNSESELRDNAWFVGLAPRRDPEIVVAVLYQSGEHGYLAAPLARDVIKAYFDKKAGKLPGAPASQKAAAPAPQPPAG